MRTLTPMTGVAKQSNTRRRCTGVYLLVQAACGVGWWIALTTSASVRSTFEIDPAQRGVLDSFLYADLLVFIAGSVTSAFGVLRVRPWAPLTLAFTAGGLSYATLQLVAWAGAGRANAPGLVVMTAATAITIALTVSEWRTRS